MRGRRRDISCEAVQGSLMQGAMVRECSSYRLRPTPTWFRSRSKVWPPLTCWLTQITHLISSMFNGVARGEGVHGQERRHIFLSGGPGPGCKPGPTKPTPKIKNSPDLGHYSLKRAHFPFQKFGAKFCPPPLPDENPGYATGSLRWNGTSPTE